MAFVLSTQVTQSKACCRVTSDCPEKRLTGAEAAGREVGKEGLQPGDAGDSRLGEGGAGRDTSEMYTEMTQRLCNKPIGAGKGLATLPEV